MSPEILITDNEPFLAREDESWLAFYNLSTDLMGVGEARSELIDSYNQGSLKIDTAGNFQNRDEIVAAREVFYSTIGVDGHTIDVLRTASPTLVPTDTFVKTQRILAGNGINPRRILRLYPLSMRLAPPTMSDKIANLTGLGLDAARVINSFPATLSYDIDTVRDKLNNLNELGLDGVRVIQRSPSVLGNAASTVKEKLIALEKFGFDVISVVNSHPPLLGLSTELVEDRFTCISDLCLDPVIIISKAPSILGYTPQAIRQKVSTIQRYTKTLDWHYSHVDILNAFPAVLSFSTKKLAVLARIAADVFSSAEQSLTPERLRTMLITSLEQYILCLSGHTSASYYPAAQLVGDAKRVTLQQAERREAALEVAPRLGKIGTRYLSYRRATQLPRAA